MAVATTGSTIQGLAQGMAHNLVGNVASNINGVSEIINCAGTPQNVVTSVVGSQVAYDVVGKNLYFSKLANGSTWMRMISGT